MIFAQVVGSWKIHTLSRCIHTSTDSLFTNIGTDCAACCLGENLTTVEAQL